MGSLLFCTEEAVEVLFEKGETGIVEREGLDGGAKGAEDGGAITPDAKRDELDGAVGVGGALEPAVGMSNTDGAAEAGDDVLSGLLFECFEE